MKHITKKQQTARELFKAEVVKWLLSVRANAGDVPVGVLQLSYDYQLKTTLGTLHVTPYDNWVACRWEDVERALAGKPQPFGMNPHSGKWNHRYDFSGKREARACAFNFAANVHLYLEQPCHAEP